MHRSSHPLVARERETRLLHSVAESARSGRGRIFLVRGESGFGKTLLLQTAAEQIRASGTVDAVLVECEAPIGRLSVSSLQTMQPFVRALESLIALNGNAAKKRLAMNIGLSVLGLIPFAGAIFDMTKEVMRDVREYRKEKEKKGGKSALDTVMTELMSSLVAIAAEKPFVIFLDEAHFMDAQSLQFLSYLQDLGSPLPFSIVIALQHAEAEKGNPACVTWMQGMAEEDTCTLNAFDIEGVRACIRAVLPGRTSLSGLDDWLLRRTSGVPIAVGEYLEYFSSHPPFREDGTLDTEILSSQSIPLSLQALLSKNIEGLAEADLNLLAMCSAEGREFSVYVMAQLMNTDILTALRELKSLQFRTGLIRSLGAQPRYGMKTTVYEFTHAVHHAFFHAKLEHEERIELHDRITHILRACFDAAGDERLREQLAPYIAAHALEAGDEETARSMLMLTAHAADEMGDPRVIDEVTSIIAGFRESPSDRALQELDAMRSDDEERSDDGVVFGGGPRRLDAACYDLREKALDAYFDGRIDESGELLRLFIEQWDAFLPLQEKTLLMSMRARCEVEMGRHEIAAEIIKDAQETLLRAPHAETQCILDNVAGTLAYRQGKASEGLYHLQHAAQTAASASDDCKLLTVTNIALAMEESNKRQARVFHRMAHQLCSALHYHEFRAAVLEKLPSGS
ncbi:MAG: ATP-binding protein [Candidatus Kapaibacterium sp.]